MSHANASNPVGWPVVRHRYGRRAWHPSALALVAGLVDGLEVVDGAGTAVSDSHDVIDLDTALVFREHPATEPAEALLHLHEQRFELVVVRALAHASASSLAGVEPVRGSAVGLGHARNVPGACDRSWMLAGAAVRGSYSLVGLGCLTNSGSASCSVRDTAPNSWKRRACGITLSRKEFTPVL